MAGHNNEQSENTNITYEHITTQTDLYDDIPAKAVGKKICLVNCKHKGNSRAGDIIRCCVCAHWYHEECVSLPHDEAGGVWPCMHCRNMPSQLKTLHDSVQILTNMNITLLDLVRKQQSQLDNIASDQTTAGGVLASLNAGLRQLTAAVAPEMIDSDEDEDSDEEVEAEGDLLIGDSLIRDIKSMSPDLTVESYSGAKFCEIKKKLKKIKPQRKRYKTITIVCGTNDTATKKPAQKIAEECKDTLQEAKLRSERVILSSVLPRCDAKADPAKIDTLNQLMVTITATEGVSFVNQDQNFKYRDDTMDESLLLPGDCLHPSAAGIKKMLANLELTDRAQPAFGDGPVPKWQPGRPIVGDPSGTQRPSPHGDRQGQPVLFKSHKDALSNFFPCELHVFNEEFKSSEHAYQWKKAKEHGQWQKADQIKSAPTAAAAKKIANSIKTSDTWKNSKADTMMMILQAKLDQCSPFRDRLSMTGTSWLIEDTAHEFWARGKLGNGLNVLGTQLMELRSSLQHQSPLRKQTVPHRQPHSSPNGQPTCYYCGESNHLKDRCRHGKTIFCRTCGGAGHKTKVHS